MLKIKGPAKGFDEPVQIELVMDPFSSPLTIKTGHMVASIPVLREDDSEAEVRFGYTPRGDIFYAVCRRANEHERYLTFVHDVAYIRPGMTPQAYINLFSFDFCDDVYTELKMREQVAEAFKNFEREVRQRQLQTELRSKYLGSSA